MGNKGDKEKNKNKGPNKPVTNEPKENPEKTVPKQNPPTSSNVTSKELKIFIIGILCALFLSCSHFS